ncbi:PLCX2-like protein [Mya arenaria]|uniref:PLCX2-like protein n=1 Tax=Mya arenaria TaxID=6604 RepID=A0ABY7FTE6_MYAAR|nr:PI-PLC X domain-containing protein 2-like [Mya arenaria]WAR25498.1 PLCX2-like protein [Mya arenaria]
MAESGDGRSDLRNWMGNLPVALHDTRISELAIPGSHDSFSYSLDPKSEIGPDAVPFVQFLGRIGAACIYKWSVSQDFSFREQLVAGVRYFDLRVAPRRTTGKFHFLHTLFGISVEDGVREIFDFLREHDKEVVILDFNHFYDMSDEKHTELIQKLIDICGEKMCVFVGIENLTLSTMWENGLQVIVIYHNKMARDFCQLWPGNDCIFSPWPHTTSVTKMVAFLEQTTSTCKPMMFHVAQCVLPPDTCFIMSHLTGGIKGDLAKNANPAALAWLKTKKRGPKGVNIAMADYMQMDDFTRKVIEMNYV